MKGGSTRAMGGPRRGTELGSGERENQKKYPQKGGLNVTVRKNN